MHHTSDPCTVAGLLTGVLCQPAGTSPPAGTPACRRLQLVAPSGCCPVCREFKLADDIYAQDSIELLKQSGIDFARNEARGIDVQKFGELLMSSGIVLNEEVSLHPSCALNSTCWLHVQGVPACPAACVISQPR